MRALSTSLSAAVLGAWLMSASSALAQPATANASAIRQSLADLQRLRAELEEANADVAALKRGDRSVRADYRLRDRMADAEALAKKVTETEVKLRALGVQPDGTLHSPSPVAPPPVAPQDGSVELEAKAGLFADQARKLDGEADRLSKVAEELRSRHLLRRRAGAWERDPFSGLEASKRSVAAPAAVSRSGPPTFSSTTGGSSPTSGTSPPTLGPTKGATGPTVSDSSGGLGPAAPGATIAVPVVAASTEAAAAAKTSPQAAGGVPDRQAIDQRLYLDPATAAELRQVLGGRNATSDPDALDRAAAALRARARSIEAQARALLLKSRTAP